MVKSDKNTHHRKILKIYMQQYKKPENIIYSELITNLRKGAKYRKKREKNQCVSTWPFENFNQLK